MGRVRSAACILDGLRNALVIPSASHLLKSHDRDMGTKLDMFTPVLDSDDVRSGLETFATPKSRKSWGFGGLPKGGKS